jgi:hypothetical protein
MFMKVASTVPASRSCIAGAPPLYGTWTALVPVSCQNSSAVRWSDVPLPADAKVILSGFALMNFIRSANVLCGELAGTVSTFGACTATVM